MKHLIALLLLAVSTLSMHAQSGKPATPDSIAIPELEMTKLENVQLKLANLQMTVQNFQAQVQKASADLQAELDQAEKAIYLRAKVQKDDYDIDIKTKSLVRKKSPPAEKK